MYSATSFAASTPPVHTHSTSSGPADTVSEAADRRGGGQHSDVRDSGHLAPSTATPSLPVKKHSSSSSLLARMKISGTTSNTVPSDFPAGVAVKRKDFINWSREINVPNVLTCTPTAENQVVDVVNWAYKNGFKVRPRGAAHNWSSLTIAPDTDGLSAKVLLVDTSRLCAVAVDKTSSTVTAQTGITMENWLTALEHEGLGMIATPAPGDLSLGGVLAIGGHGTRIPANGEVRSEGHTFGSLSNAVLELKAVVWNEDEQKYGLRSFCRSENDIQAFLTHVGRAFIVEVRMQAGPNQNLRCRSYDQIPAETIFCSSGLAKESFASFLNEAGGIEALYFPTGKVWLKTWKVEESKPVESTEVKAPYNYPFSNNLPRQFSGITSSIISHAGPLTPSFSKISSQVVSSGLKKTGDLWGKSKNVLLYIKPSTLRVTANGYAVLTRREHVQRVVHEYYRKVTQLLEKYQKQGSYPISCPFEIRVTGLDKQDEVMADTPRSPVLSPVRRRPDHPEWDIAVWLDILTVPGTKDSNKFLKEIEDWTFENYSGDYAGVRVEWSKGWGYTEKLGPWQDDEVLHGTVPDTVSAGQGEGHNWNAAVEILDRYDPHRLYSSPLLDKLFKKRISQAALVPSESP